MSYRKAAVILALGFMCFSPRGMAVMEASDKDVSVKKLGVSWNIAEDRKMERIGGMYEPEGLDKYMKRYFEQLSAKVEQLTEQSKRLEKKVEELISKSNQALGAQQQKKNEPATSPGLASGIASDRRILIS